MIERTAAARHAGLDSLFVGDHHVSPTPANDQRMVPGSLERLEEVCVMLGERPFGAAAAARSPVRLAP